MNDSAVLAGPSGATLPRTGLLLIALTLLAPFALYFGTARSLVEIWNSSETFAHGYIILPISLRLIWRRRANFAAYPPEPWAPALLLVALAGAGWLLARMGELQVVMQYAFVAMLVFIALAMLGRRLALARIRNMAVAAMTVAAVWPGYVLYSDRATFNAAPVVLDSAGVNWTAAPAFNSWTPRFMAADASFNGARSEQLGSRNLALRETRMQGPTGDFLVWSWNWIDGETVTNNYVGKLYQARAKLLFRGDDGATVMVSAPYGEQPDEARAAMRTFLADNLASIEASLASARGR